MKWRRSDLAGSNAHGGRGEPMKYWEDSVEAFKQTIDQVRYRGLRPNTAKDPQGQATDALDTNEEYWDLIRRDRLYEGTPVRLAGFYLTEWVPLTPGRFHSPDAARTRDMARYHIDSMDPVRGVDYRPMGKISMIRGGIGTVRLSSLHVADRSLHVLGATSDGVCHSGIPIVLSGEQYESAISGIREHGGIMADISGVMRVIPEVVKHHTDRLVLDVTDIRPRKATVSPTSVKATACIAFYTRAGQEPPDAYSFITFRPGMPDALDAAVQWLDRYVRRFSEDETPRIVTDFDAYHDHFPDVEIPLKNVTRGVLDLRNLERHHPELMRSIHVHGDLFSNVTNSTITNRSTVGGALSWDDDER
jgi:hypothetical protein